MITDISIPKASVVLTRFGLLLFLSRRNNVFSPGNYVYFSGRLPARGGGERREVKSTGSADYRANANKLPARRPYLSSSFGRAFLARPPRCLHVLRDSATHQTGCGTGVQYAFILRTNLQIYGLVIRGARTKTRNNNENRRRLSRIVSLNNSRLSSPISLCATTKKHTNLQEWLHAYFSVIIAVYKSLSVRKADVTVTVSPTKNQVI